MSGARRNASKATRGQLVLVTVLAVVLVGVVANNFRGGAVEVAAAQAPAATPAKVASPSVPPPGEAETTAAATPAESASPFGEFAEGSDWPDKPLEQLVEFDPLAPPAWVAAPVEGAETANTTDLEELQQAQNAIIFVTDGVRVARIGEQEYHVGDAIGRFRITDISSAGIVLSDPEGGAGDR